MKTRTALTVLFVFLAGVFVLMQVRLSANVFVWIDSENVKYISNIRPEWWMDEMNLMPPGTVVAPDKKMFPGTFIGDRENRKFHWPLCTQIYNPQGSLAIPMEKQIWFQDYSDAISQGYHVCDHCEPSEDGTEYQPPTP